jgi:hypothetical protein
MASRVKRGSRSGGAQKGVQALWLHEGANQKIRAWREKVGWSAERLARELGYRGRSYVKHMESKTKPWFITPQAAKRLKALMRKTKPGLKLAEPKRTLIFTRFVLPAKLRLDVRPRRCRGHGRASIMAANQVYCGSTKKERAECRKVWGRRERKKRREAED